MSLLSSLVKRSIAGRGAWIYVSALLDQQANHGHVTMVTGHVQWGVTGARSCIRIDAGAQQQLRNWHAVLLCAQM